MYGIHVEVIMNANGSCGTEISLTDSDLIMLSLKVQCWTRGINQMWPPGSFEGPYSAIVQVLKVNGEDVDIIRNIVIYPQDTLTVLSTAIDGALGLFIPDGNREPDPRRN